MKMNKLMILMAAAFAMTACSSPESIQGNESAPTRKALEISLTPMTRAGVNYTAADYFGIDGYDQAEITLLSGTRTFVSDYLYNGGELLAQSEEETIWFPYQGNATSITVLWPKPDQRQDIPFDQSERETFLLADWLRADLTDVAPVSVLPVELTHEHSKLSFSLTGSLVGTKITWLEFGGYTTYCDTSATITDAQVMVPNDITLSAGDTGRLIYQGDEYVHSFRIGTPPGISEQAGSNYTIEIDLD